MDLAPEAGKPLQPGHPVGEKARVGRPTTMAAMATFIPTTTAAVFQVHLDLVDFSEITSQLS